MSDQGSQRPVSTSQTKDSHPICRSHRILGYVRWPHAAIFPKNVPPLVASNPCSGNRYIEVDHVVFGYRNFHGSRFFIFTS